MCAPLEEPVEDGLCQVGIMEHLAQGRQGFVGRHDRGALFQVTMADDAEEHIGSVGGVALIPQLIDDQDMRLDIGLERLFQATAVGGAGEFADQLVGGGETSLEAILNGAVGNGDAEMRFSSARGTR